MNQDHCNSLDPPLADIVLFELTLKALGFKTRLLGEGLHTLIKGVLFSRAQNSSLEQSVMVSSRQIGNVVMLLKKCQAIKGGTRITNPSSVTAQTHR